jgi:hypothetical protein
LLATVLTYHVVSGKVLSSDLTDGQVINTVQGGTLTVGISGNTVTLTDAAGQTSTVTAADLEASNGVIHVIDTVLLPFDPTTLPPEDWLRPSGALGVQGCFVQPNGLITGATLLSGEGNVQVSGLVVRGPGQGS